MTVKELSTTQATHTVEVGAIYQSRWGYDQTNVTFYLVTGTTATTATLVEIGKLFEPITDCGTRLVTPNVSDVRSDAFRRKVHARRGNAIKVASYAIARPWCGNPLEEDVIGR